MVDFQILEFFGGLLIWCLRGFNGSLKDAQSHKYSAVTGLLVVTALILIVIKVVG